jgi:choline dehydrogenase-like flavoprotein
VIVDPNSLGRDQSLRADVCVIGSGAGGAVVAKELAEKGLRVIVLEEGRYNTSRDFTQREADMFPRLYREQASRATADFSVLVLQGRTVGGSTVPSFCSSFRPPPAILDAWEQQRGLSGVGSALMAPYFERVEKALGVRLTTETEVNANNACLREGAKRLDLRGRLLSHSRIDCVGCGYCALGCAYDRKNDGLTVYLPAAVAAGALLLPQCRVESVEPRGGQGVASVRAALQRDDGKAVAVSVQARAVVLAAGAVASPQLWLQSRLADSVRQVGRHLHLHPQVAVHAVFGEKIEAWNGVPQAYVVDHFLRTEVGGGGFSLIPVFGHPVTASALIAGFGAEHRRRMESYSHLATVAVTLHDRSEGHIDVDGQGRPTVDYHLGDDDRADLLDGIRRAAEIFFAAGAQSVVLPFAEMVELKSLSELAAIHRVVRTSDPVLVSYQPHGTLRMGRDARDSVVDAFGRAHEVPGLYVADASLFPTALAVPPQLTTMAFATRVAEHVRADLGPGARGQGSGSRGRGPGS